MTSGFSVQQYHAKDSVIWDEFVSCSRSAHFMFYRNFMDYHADRFNDHSLMIYDQHAKLVALLPANISNSVLYSHQGLTFGGLLFKAATKQHTVTEALQAICRYAKSMQITRLVYKKAPFIYSAVPADEDAYALFLCGAKLYRRDLSSAIAYGQQLPYSQQRRGLVNKAAAMNWQLEEPVEFTACWSALSAVLLAHHNTTPTHTEQEITLLKQRFPSQIRIYTASLHNEVCAGAVLFCTSTVVHAQYLFATERGRATAALDWLLNMLISRYSTSHAYFNFGTSNERSGVINQGLLTQKESFGARAVLHDHYEVVLGD